MGGGQAWEEGCEPAGWPPLHRGFEGGTLPTRPPHGLRVPGRLINTIRVVCASYEDYGRWLLCLQTVCHKDGASLLPGPESFPGLRAPTQVRGWQQRDAVPQLGSRAVVETGGWVWAWVRGERCCRLTLTHHRLPRLWVVAKARSPRMDGPAGTQGAWRPPPPAPATPSLSPWCPLPQTALPSLHW